MTRRLAHLCPRLACGPPRLSLSPLARAVLISLAFVLAATFVGDAQAARPPIPAGGRALSPGGLPRECVAGDAAGGALSAYGTNYGYYYSSTAKAWVQAPFCYPRWGNLEASASGIVSGGGIFTVTAIPTDGSNSAIYAPETKSISWTHPGTVVSGCGSADLSCTVRVGPATAEWQWLEFHVTMPRTFFVDSPGSNCAGQHLCAGATTNAWSFVGIRPTSRVCTPDCNALAVEFDPTVDPAKAAVDFDETCGGAPSCTTELEIEADPTVLEIRRKVDETDLRGRDASLKASQRLLDKMLKMTQQNQRDMKAKLLEGTGEKYIRARTSPATAVALAEADAGLDVMFPPVATATSRPVAIPTRSAEALGGPSTTLVLRALYSARPSAAALRAFADALSLATQPAFSPERARARLQLALGLAVGRRVLARDLGVTLRGPRTSGPVILLGSGRARIAAGGQRTLTVPFTSSGRRVLRIIDLARGGAPASVRLVVTLTRGGRTSRASRALAVG